MKEYIFKIISVLLVAAGMISGCGSVKNDKSNKQNNVFAAFLALAQNQVWFFVSNSTGANMYAYSHSALGNNLAQTITLPSTSSGEMVGAHTGHVYVVMKGDNSGVGVIDTSSGTPVLTKSLTVGVRPGHMYLSPDGEHIWVMNDGNAAAPDKGADMTNCNTNQASISVIKDGGAGATGDAAAKVLKTVCIGRGHHKAAFSTSPSRAFVSNITDGTITVIDADPASITFMTVLSTLSLCDSVKEATTCPVGTLGTTNSATPHGIAYSSVSGKIYNSNTGYGTVTAIKASTLVMETIAVGFTGTMHASPDGKFMALRGSDTKSDANHVIGKVNVISVTDHQVKTVSVPDFYPDHLMFNHDVTRLYVVSATGGTGNQLTNLKNNVMMVYNASNSPELTLVKEVEVGQAGGSHRSLDIISNNSIVVPNDKDMTVSIVDYATNTVKQTINFTGNPNAVYVNSHESHGH